MIVGGTQAVGGQVFTEVAELDTIDNVERVAGPDPTGTAAELADQTGPGWVGYCCHAILASGLTFPDALVAGPVAGPVGRPDPAEPGTTSDLGPVTAAWITDTEAVRRVTILGGTTALSRHDRHLGPHRALTDRN